MKIKFENICLSVLLMTILTACSALKHQNEVPPDLRRDWKLVALDGFDKDFLMKNNAGISLQHSVFKLNTGCGPFSFKIKAKTSGNIRFWDFGGDALLCPADFGLQKAVVSGLKSSQYYQINGHFLTLYGHSGATMKLIAADWD